MYTKKSIPACLAILALFSICSCKKDKAASPATTPPATTPAWTQTLIPPLSVKYKPTEVLYTPGTSSGLFSYYKIGYNSAGDIASIAAKLFLNTDTLHTYFIYNHTAALDTNTYYVHLNDNKLCDTLIYNRGRTGKYIAYSGMHILSVTSFSTDASLYTSYDVEANSFGDDIPTSTTYAYVYDSSKNAQMTDGLRIEDFLSQGYSFSLSRHQILNQDLYNGSVYSYDGMRYNYYYDSLGRVTTLYEINTGHYGSDQAQYTFTYGN